MDSTTLPERSRHDDDPRRQRRRRSAARLPALVSPVDVPEDAEGRIQLLVVRAAPDREESARSDADPAASREGRVRAFLTLGSGWAAVGVLAALLVVLFLVPYLVLFR